MPRRYATAPRQRFIYSIENGIFTWEDAPFDKPLEWQHTPATLVHQRNERGYPGQK